MNDLRGIAIKIASLSGVIFLENQFRITDKLYDSNDNAVITAFKSSALLAGTGFISDLAIDKLYGDVRDSDKKSWAYDFASMGTNFVSNAIIFYALEYAELDEKIIGTGTVVERSVRLGVLFWIVEMVTNKFLLQLLNKYGLN